MYSHDKINRNPPAKDGDKYSDIRKKISSLFRENCLYFPL